MAQTKAQLRAAKKYHNKFDDIKVRVPKGQRQAWQTYAASTGESLNTFICRAVYEAMEKGSKNSQE